MFQALLYFKFRGKFHRNLNCFVFLCCLETCKVLENREKDEIDEVSVLKYTEN